MIDNFKNKLIGEYSLWHQQLLHDFEKYYNNHFKVEEQRGPSEIQDQFISEYNEMKQKLKLNYFEQLESFQE